RQDEWNELSVPVFTKSAFALPRLGNLALTESGQMERGPQGDMMLISIQVHGNQAVAAKSHSLKPKGDEQGFPVNPIAMTGLRTEPVLFVLGHRRRQGQVAPRISVHPLDNLLIGGIALP